MNAAEALNAFVAGPDGGPTLTLRLGETLHDLAIEHRPAGLEFTSDRTWVGTHYAWLNFVDLASDEAKEWEDEDLALLTRWLDEDIDKALDDPAQIEATA